MSLVKSMYCSKVVCYKLLAQPQRCRYKRYYSSMYRQCSSFVSRILYRWTNLSSTTIFYTNLYSLDRPKYYYYPFYLNDY